MLFIANSSFCFLYSRANGDRMAVANRASRPVERVASR